MSKLNHLALLVLFLASTVTPASAQTEPAAPAISLRNLAHDAPLPPEGLARASVARTNDSLWNGALIGAGTAVAGSLLLCRSMEPWEVCRDDVGAMATSAAIGAAIGIAVDALIRRQASATSPAGRGRRPDARRWARFLKIPARR